MNKARHPSACVLSNSALTGGQDTPDEFLLADATILIPVNASEDVQHPRLLLADPLHVTLPPGSKVELGKLLQLSSTQMGRHWNGDPGGTLGPTQGPGGLFCEPTKLPLTESGGHSGAIEGLSPTGALKTNSFLPVPDRQSWGGGGGEGEQTSSPPSFALEPKHHDYRML